MRGAVAADLDHAATAHRGVNGGAEEDPLDSAAADYGAACNGIAVPPTFKKPPLLTTVLIAVPPELTFSAPPLRTIVPLVMPPANTTSTSPPLIVALMAAPPRSCCSPPLSTVVPLAVLPENTCSKPPL